MVTVKTVARLISLLSREADTGQGQDSL